MFNCGICERRVPLAFKNEHHVRPEAAGGTDADLKPLCAGCHQNLHALEKMLRGPKAAQAADVAKAFYYDNLGAAQRCLAFAHEAVRWFSAKKDGQADANPRAHDDVDITIQVPYAVKQYLLSLGKTARNEQTGKPLGLVGVLRNLVLSSVFRQNPGLKEVVGKSFVQAQIAKEPKRSVGFGPQPKRNVLSD